MQSLAAMSALLLLLMPACSYGPVVDRSGVVSAVVMPDGETVGVAYQVLRYRPAEGIAAFPDGGIPRYLDDRIVIAATARGATRVLQRLENHGVSGAASVGLRTARADPGHLLVLYNEQASTSVALKRRLWRLDFANGAATPYPDLTAGLAATGRRLGSSEFGDVRVIASDGTLLIGAEGPQGDELWLWSPASGYRRLDGLKHFYGVTGDELYYWSGDEARVMNWRTGAVRTIARYDPVARQTTTLLPHDPTVTELQRPAPSNGSVSWNGDQISLARPDGSTKAIELDRSALTR
jgi:hypothetical protein